MDGGNIFERADGNSFLNCLISMRKCLLILLLCAHFPLLAQWADEDSIEVTEAESKKLRYQKRAIFLGAGVDQSTVFGSLENALFLRGGVQYRQFIAGGFYSHFDQMIQQQIIFPNYFDLRFRHAGGFLGYQVWERKRLSANFLVQYSMGDAVWTSAATLEDTFRDEISFLGLIGEVEYRPIRFAWLYVDVGYRQVLGLDLASTKPSDLSGFNFNFGIKIGVFWEQTPVIITDDKGQ